MAPTLQQQLQRAKERLDASRTDGEYEANRQIVIWLQAQVDALKNGRAA